jgi:T5SS/PEP-CTERM-associated repeat protein
MTKITFTGGGTAGDWADPANWKGDVAPGIADNVQILDGASMAVNGTVSVNAIMIINGGTDTFTGAVSTAGVGNCQGFMVCVGSTAVFGPGSSLNDGGVFQIGVGGIGGFIANGTSAAATAIHSHTGTIGKLAAGVGTVTINDASWTTTDSLVVGALGSGTLNVLSGGQVNVGTNLAMGFESGAVGTATLSSGGTVMVDGSASIGGGDKASPLGTGTLTVNAGSTFDVHGGIGVSDGSAVNLDGGTVSAGDQSGSLMVQAGGHITGHGTLTGRTGSWINDSGTIEASGGTLDINASLTGQGAVLIDAGSTVAITGRALLMPRLTFSGADATLSLASAATVNSTISGFTFGDQIEMPGIDRAVWNSHTQTLQLSDAGHLVDTLHLSGSYGSDVFSVAHTGTLGVITLHTG